MHLLFESKPVKNIPLAVNPKLEQTNVDTSGFRTIEIKIEGISTTTPINVSLTSENNDTRYITLLNGNSDNVVNPVKPGEYSVQVDPISINGHRYLYDGPDNVIIMVGTNNQVLILSFIEAMNIAVKGFPDFVANGTVTNDSVNVTEEIGSTKVDAIFKYAGLSGSGDPGVILAKDSLPLHRTMKNAIIAQSLSGKPVLPIMVVYTSNASGGATWTDLINQDLLYKHYATFMTQAIAAQEYSKGEGQSPMSFVLNPDFLGELQKNTSSVANLNIEGTVHVNENLKKALEYIKKEYDYEYTDTLPVFDNTLNGYISSLNFIMDKFAPEISYGWQINLWAVGSANWIHSNEDQSENVGKEVADFVNSINVYNGDYQPDYIVFDKYERDGFGGEAIANYAYNATSWQRYLSYVKTISDGVDSPAMIWQIPGGHMPTQTEGNSLIQSNHQASGGTFFMGDARIGEDVNLITTDLLNKPLNPSVYNGASNVHQLLAKDQGYNWSTINMKDLPKYNVFALLWGGGSTTAVVSIGSNGTDNGWLSTRVDSYVADPSCLYAPDCTGAIFGGDNDDIVTPDNLPPVIDLNSSFNAVSGETVTVLANVTDPENDPLSYQWKVPAELKVVGGSTSNTITITAPNVSVAISYTLMLSVSDGVNVSKESTTLKVNTEESDNDNICEGISEFNINNQYQPGEEVTYEDNLYKAERWTDVGLTPDTPYAGWVLVDPC